VKHALGLEDPRQRPGDEQHTVVAEHDVLKLGSSHEGLVHELAVAAGKIQAHPGLDLLIARHGRVLVELAEVKDPEISSAVIALADQHHERIIFSLVL
jgi:hypothetical protein